LMATIGRPPTCDCGTCHKCKRRVYMREWYHRQTPEKRRAIVAARDPEAMRKASLRAAAARRPTHPAHTAVHNAIRDGRLRKQPCQECGTWLVHAHHHMGYEPEHWLDVQWLCVRHHKAVHGHLRAA
jgi:hypothetical protein